jgi:hypothetical protein
VADLGARLHRGRGAFGLVAVLAAAQLGLPGRRTPCPDHRQRAART